ncbi:MAG: S-ribosylhomocysteine lyase [Ruminococcaceae bacterium]|nr:S-ribosylhomocysteine lyase [Oscillospiraceae bacterium]
MERITSFCVDHDFIDEGIYISRIDGDITTYDLRTRKPNCGDYMDNITMHSVEHLFATYIRNSEIGDKVIYFGPMGCRTGFYLLIRDADNGVVLEEVLEVLKKIENHEGEVFGATRKECGNYLELDADAARKEAARYRSALLSKKNDFKYQTGEEK